MTQFTGSIALLRHPRDLEKRWLAWWNERRRFFDFVIAERLEGDSFRECIDREIAWTLNLRRGKDYLVSQMARLHLQDTVSVSGVDTSFTVQFFVADVFGRVGRAAVEENPELQWLTNEEVLAGRTSEQLPVNPTLVTLLERADVIRRHQH